MTVTERSSLKDLIMSHYLFDKGFNFEKDLAKDPRLNLVAQGLFDELVTVSHSGCPDLAEKEWQIEPGATPFQKVQAAFCFVRDGDALPISRAQRGDLPQYYQALKKEMLLKDSRLALWRVLVISLEGLAHGSGSSEYWTCRSAPCSAAEVASKFNTWIEENPWCLSVTELQLNKRELVYLPPEIEKFKELKVLDLKENRFQIFPTEVLHLPNLKRINLEGNQIEALPGEVENLTHLVFLDLSSNRIKDLPEGFKGLPELRMLFLSDNLFEEFPPILVDLLPQMKGIMLSRNPIKHIPDEVFSKIKSFSLAHDLDQLTLVRPPDLTRLHAKGG